MSARASRYDDGSVPQPADAGCVASIAFTLKSDGEQFHKLRKSVESLSVAWSAETLLSGPSNRGEMKVAVKLTAKNKSSLHAARELIRQCAKITTFDFVDNLKGAGSDRDPFQGKRWKRR